MPAVFEQMWFERCQSLMLEEAGALALIAKLCGDADTVNSVLEGDEAARHQLQDAFRHLGAVSGRFDEIGPPPQRLSAIAGIACRALAMFAQASVEFDAGVEHGLDTEVMERVSGRIREGDALLGELRSTSAPARPGD